MCWVAEVSLCNCLRWERHRSGVVYQGTTIYACGLVFLVVAAGMNAYEANQALEMVNRVATFAAFKVVHCPEKTQK